MQNRIRWQHSIRFFIGNWDFLHSGITIKSHTKLHHLHCYKRRLTSLDKIPTNKITIRRPLQTGASGARCVYTIAVWLDRNPTHQRMDLIHTSFW